MSLQEYDTLRDIIHRHLNRMVFNEPNRHRGRFGLMYPPSVPVLSKFVTYYRANGAIELALYIPAFF